VKCTFYKAISSLSTTDSYSGGYEDWIFWDMAPCNVMKFKLFFGWECRFHLQCLIMCHARSLHRAGNRHAYSLTMQTSTCLMPVCYCSLFDPEDSGDKSSKLLLVSNELHSVIYQITTAVRILKPKIYPFNVPVWQFSTTQIHRILKTSVNVRYILFVSFHIT
jgi:hypothetical protein